MNRALSMLTAWFRLLYVAGATFGVLNLATAYRVLNGGDYVAAFGAQQLHAQVKLLIASFRFDFSMALLIFAVHLLLLGYLIYRSGYIPRVLGIVMVIVGVIWVVFGLRPYFFPGLNLGFIPILGFAELLLPLWLLAKGWRVLDGTAAGSR